MRSRDRSDFGVEAAQLSSGLALRVRPFDGGFDLCLTELSRDGLSERWVDRAALILVPIP